MPLGIPRLRAGACWGKMLGAGLLPGVVGPRAALSPTLGSGYLFAHLLFDDAGSGQHLGVLADVGAGKYADGRPRTAKIRGCLIYFQHTISFYTTTG